jgi:DNA adenine methylase
MQTVLTDNAKPFLKWAGGKTQLIPAIEKSLPKKINWNEVTYVEPFAGSGAVLFWMLRQQKGIKRAIINDVNTELTTAYEIIKREPQALINELQKLDKQFKAYQSQDDRKLFYLEQRTRFNASPLKSQSTLHTALLIFLNRTCFNGLYRVNSKGQFNVPFGQYANPKICDEATIMSVSNILQRVTILNGDFEASLNHVNGNAFFYFDPPYRPISSTSSFNSYASEVFCDQEQKRLAAFCQHIHQQGHQWLLSNSDPKNHDPSDNFFDELYKDFHITRIEAKRMINSNAQKRGTINELLIANYSLP